MPEPVHVIANPASSGGRGGRVIPLVRKELQRREIPFELQKTTGPGHATTLAREALDRAARRILVVGGDGTLNEVANGLVDDPSGADTPVAVFPVGTGNDFYRMVGAPRSLEGAMAMLENGTPRPFDVGRARWSDGSRFFVNFMGLGVDVEVLHRREGFRRLPGMAQYLAALLAAVVGYEPFAVRVTLEEEAFQERIHLCAVCVGPYAAGGFLLCPGARPDDGLLDLCLVRALSHLQVLRYIPRVIRGTHEGLDVVRIRRLRTIRIEAPEGRSFRFQLDGELVEGRTTWLEGEILPARLSILVPDEPRP